MELKNKTIYFRLVEVEDAEFITSLRVDNTYNKYLTAVEGSVSQQAKWILDYKKREELKEEYYFIIHRNIDSQPIGTVRLYDFLGNKDSFCWGSWILNEKKTRYAALECATLIYDLAFIELRFKRCHMDIRKGNLKVIEFHKKFGVKIIGETENDLLGHYFLDDYLKIQKNIKTFIESKTSI